MTTTRQTAASVTFGAQPNCVIDARPSHHWRSRKKSPANHRPTAPRRAKRPPREDSRSGRFSTQPNLVLSSNSPHTEPNSPHTETHHIPNQPHRTSNPPTPQAAPPAARTTPSGTAFTPPKTTTELSTAPCTCSHTPAPPGSTAP